MKMIQKNKRGDCDSFRYDENGRQVRVCYDQAAIQRYARQWGEIVDIGIAQ